MSETERTQRAEVRASDAEREAVVELLTGHGATGRLATEELDERVEAALRARTRAELDGLLHDLPGKPRGGERRPSRPPRERVGAPPSRGRWPGRTRLAGAGAVGVAVAASGEPALLWLLWPVLAVGKACKQRRRPAAAA